MSIIRWQTPPDERCIIIYMRVSVCLCFIGTLICENLPQELCAFSISSKGKRCLLENYAGANGKVGYQCRTSDVDVGRMSNYIEKEDCVKACGADRKAVGISSDSLMEPQFTAKLCSPNCFQNCPNIIDLYFNLAAGEGNAIEYNIYAYSCLISFWIFYHKDPRL